MEEIKDNELLKIIGSERKKKIESPIEGEGKKQIWNRNTMFHVGIESKKEIFPESTLLKLNNLAAVIVIPALLTPGINASI